MKILLVGVNSRYIHTNPALYALRRAAAAGDKARQLDLAQYTLSQPPAETVADIYGKRPDILAFSLYIWNADYLRSILFDLKRLLPHSLLLLGGPEASARAKHYLASLPADAVCVGEGEESFPALLAALPAACGTLPWQQPETAAALRAVKGWLWRGHEREYRPAAPPDLNRLPFLYDAAAVSELKGQGKAVYYESSRGCPYACAFCASASEPPRLRSLKLVLPELEQLAEIGGQIKFVDRTFNADPERAIAITERVLALHRPGLSWHFEISPARLNPELVALWLAAPRNYLKLEMGVQTLHAPALAAIRRADSWAEAEPLVKRIIAAGNTHLHLDLIAGLPADTPSGFARSFHRLHQLDADYLQFGFLKLLPGSPLAARAAELKLLAGEFPPYRVWSTPDMPAEYMFALYRAERLFQALYNKGRYEFRPALIRAAETYAGGALAMYMDAARDLPAGGWDQALRQEIAAKLCLPSSGQ